MGYLISFLFFTAAPAPAPAPALAPALPVACLGSPRHGDGDHLVTEGTFNILTSALKGRRCQM